MRSVFLLFFFIKFSFCITAQNLIPNPSFEDVNVCTTYREKCSPSAWRAAELKCFLYPEYLNGKDEEGKPIDGSRHIALRVFNRGKSEDRSFAQAPLLCPLVKGETYELTFYIYAQVFMVKQLGVLFSDSIKIYKKNKELFNSTKFLQIEFPQKIPSKQWVKVSKKFTATGNEKTIMFGNFLPDSLTQIKKLVKAKKYLPNRVYYGFDQITLKPQNEGTIECDLNFTKQNIYKDSIRHIRRHRPILSTTISKVEPIKPPPTIEDSISIDPPFFDSTVIIKKREVFTLSNLQFEFNRSNIRSSSFPVLDSLSNFLLNFPLTAVQITGHTDNIGSRQANLRLSAARALAVKNYLINTGIAPERIQTSGRGDQIPVESNETESGRAANRRVEFLIE